MASNNSSSNSNPSSNSNTIDLTDEDDAKPQRTTQINPPALVALNMRGRQQIVPQQQQQQQQQTVQRHVVTAQQPLRSAQVVTQTRKLPVISMYSLFVILFKRKIESNF